MSRLLAFLVPLRPFGLREVPPPPELVWLGFRLVASTRIKAGEVAIVRCR